jgi:hypothetical protein
VRWEILFHVWTGFRFLHSILNHLTQNIFSTPVDKLCVKTWDLFAKLMICKLITDTRNDGLHSNFWERRIII